MVLHSSTHPYSDRRAISLNSSQVHYASHVRASFHVCPNPDVQNPTDHLGHRGMASGVQKNHSSGWSTCGSEKLDLGATTSIQWL